ncbi:hypothetical protein CKAN_00233200 [Cinnamomum micranthum f. kanehirae]|uniref:Uncharacterized protein n=1 Tax=Cinnamomum micranthum f. kanehirae TaxID=337451 RepID=A0A443N693_9MAGN|nr:hypothetical protein CKAN_00233200 [Cinnamomum micranthum f. kanehirae]
MPSSLPTSIIVVAKKSITKAETRLGGEEEDNILLRASLAWDLCFSTKREMKVDGFWLFSNGKSTNGRSMKRILAERRTSLCQCLFTCLCHLFSSLSHLLPFLRFAHQTPHSLLQLLSTNPPIFLIIQTQFHCQTVVAHQLKCIELLLCIQGPSQHGYTKPYALQG